MGDVEDDALLAAFAVGDPDAGAQFVRRYQRRVFGLARSIVDERPLAEDLTQEAFVRAWRHASSYDPRRGSVASWLLAITRNLALDACRSRRTDPLGKRDFVSRVERVLDADGDPAGAAERRDEVERLIVAIRRVPGPQRRAVVLAALGGLTAREVSESERVPLGTAKTRIRTGLRTLRDLLRETSQQEEAGR
jgi:RNA polymerase sigma-70 factor (ECF subfamily)